MRGEKNHFSLLSWFVFIQIVNVPILIKIANLLKDLALKKKKELEEKKHSKYVLLPKKWCENKSFIFQ